VTRAGLALLLAVGCTPGTPPTPESALVELVRLETDPRPTWGDTPGWAGLASRWVPYCSAFGVARAGRVQLATAAHCVSSQPVHYRCRAGVSLASVVFVSEARDVAYLDPLGCTPSALEPGPTPPVGEMLSAHSSLYAGPTYGRVVEHYVSGYYETTQTIVYGWSGSPVVDHLGRAVGLVAKCPSYEGRCVPGHTIVASLP
jgi:hypothetical protein